jgi:hypothetical protein
MIMDFITECSSRDMIKELSVPIDVHGLGSLAFPGSSPARERKTFRAPIPAPRYSRGLPALFLSISNAVRPGVAGCLGNESLIRGEEAH